MDAVPENNGTQQEVQTTNIYVARLPDWVTDDVLRTKFELFGTILSCKVLNGRSGPKGVGFVQYTTPEMAMKAVNAMNNTCIGNKTVDVRLAHRDKNKGVQNQPSTNIYVCNLPKSYGEAELYALFSPHGAIKSLVVLMDRKTWDSKCVGMIRFANLEDAKAAVETLNGRMLECYDRPLEVKYAEDSQAKEQRLEKDKVDAKKQRGARDQDGARANDAEGCGPTPMNVGHEDGADAVYAKPPGWANSQVAPGGVPKDQQQGKMGPVPQLCFSNIPADSFVQPRYPWAAAVIEVSKLSTLSERSGTDHHLSKEVLAAWNKHLRAEKGPMEIWDDHGALALTEFDASLDLDAQLMMANVLAFCKEASSDSFDFHDLFPSSNNNADGSHVSDNSGRDLARGFPADTELDPWAIPPPPNSSQLFQPSVNPFEETDAWDPSVASPLPPRGTDALFAPFRASMGKLSDDSPGLTFSAASEGGQPSPILGPLMLDNVHDAAALLPLSV
jgi:RNA recognition motif-containing protein